MARTRNIASIDEKIKNAQEVVERTKRKYDDAVAALEALMEKKDEMKRAMLMEAIMHSNKSTEDILNFLRSDTQIE